MICGFVLAFVDQPLDERALAVGLLGLGDVERDFAGHAHHLALDRRQRRARRARQPTRAGAQSQRERTPSRASTTRPRSAALHERSAQRDRAVEELLVDLAAGERDDLAPAVDDEALGQLVGAVGVREGAGVVAQVRIGEVVAAHEAQRVRRGVQVGDAEHRRVVAFELRLGALEQRRLDLAG